MQFISGGIDGVLQVWALVEVMALCSWTKYFTLSVPLFTQGYDEFNAWSNPAMD